MSEEDRVLSRKHRIVDEHFWFTATALGFNAFLISLASKDSAVDAPDVLALCSIIVSLYASYLIIHRSAAYADKLQIPKRLEGVEEKEKSFLDKGQETVYHLWTCARHVPWVVFEFSGSLFYLLLVVLSSLGVLYAHF